MCAVRVQQEAVRFGVFRNFVVLDAFVSCHVVIGASSTFDVSVCFVAGRAEKAHRQRSGQARRGALLASVFPSHSVLLQLRRLGLFASALLLHVASADQVEGALSDDDSKHAWLRPLLTDAKSFANTADASESSFCFGRNPVIL